MSQVTKRALEASLKLKEISYIHAEAYAAGELKHGPLALVDEDMPVVTVAPNDRLLEKLKSNMQEVRARAVVNLAHAVEKPCIKKHCFSQSGFAFSAVAEDGNIADAVSLIVFHIVVYFPSRGN